MLEAPSPAVAGGDNRGDPEGRSVGLRGSRGLGVQARGARVDDGAAESKERFSSRLACRGFRPTVRTDPEFHCAASKLAGAASGKRYSSRMRSPSSSDHAIMISCLGIGIGAVTASTPRRAPKCFPGHAGVFRGNFAPFSLSRHSSSATCLRQLELGGITAVADRACRR